MHEVSYRTPPLKTRLPESIAGAIWSSQNGNARSKVNFKFSAFGITSDGMFA